MTAYNNEICIPYQLNTEKFRCVYLTIDLREDANIVEFAKKLKATKGVDSND